jgi:argininosuccinate lyase
MTSKRWNKHYISQVLRPNFEQARKYFFKLLLRINAEHTVMLERCGLLETRHARAILEALEVIRHERFSYSEGFEDLYFAIEARILEIAGLEAGGNLQIARSRNDVDATMFRVCLRDALLELLSSLEGLRSALVERGLESLSALMPGYTHHQPAQPTTLAHYFSGMLGVLERDAQRLHDAYQRINRSPMGAAAMTTTGFAIRRDLTAAWLGFDGLAENGIDAVGGVDHTLGAVSAAQICATGLSRFNTDLLMWASLDVGFMRVPDNFVQISSIMPQKRNPVVLEHIRAKLGRSSGAAQTVFTLAHNVPFADVNDVGEPMLQPALNSLSELHSALELLADVIRGANFDLERMRTRAGEHFITATGLADALVGQGLSFKQAHSVVSRVVGLASTRGLTSIEVTAELLNEAALERIGRTIEVDDAFVQHALDPQAFVLMRTHAGGSAPSAVKQALEQAQQALRDDIAWRRNEQRRLKAAQKSLDTEVRALKLEPVLAADD